MTSSKQQHRTSIKLNKKNKIFIVIGITLLLIMLVIDFLYLRGRIFNKEIPLITPSNIIRTIVVIASILFVILGIVSEKWTHLSSLKILNNTYQKLVVLISFFLGLFFLLLFSRSPKWFSYLSVEDGLIEWTSFTLLIGCVIIMFISFIYTVRKPNINWKVKAFIALAFFGFLLIGLEEVSWFQRVLDIKTPEAFRGNWQGEMNLHNFSTHWAENMYYFGAFMFLIVLPISSFIFHNLIKKYKISILIPELYISISVAIAYAFNYTMWNTLLVQISFFGSLILLVVIAKLCRNNFRRYQIMTLALLMIFTQTYFLLNGENLLRTWELTEYKEFFIPLAFFFYCWNILVKLRRLTD